MNAVGLRRKPSSRAVQWQCGFTVAVAMSTLLFLSDMRSKTRGGFSEDQDSFYRVYHSAEDLQQRLRSVINGCRNSLLQTVAHSHEGRPILMARIGTTNDRRPSRFIVTAGMHGRERSTAQICLYAIERYCTDGGQQDSPFSRIEGLFVPLINPDGYEHSRTVLRKWRKNRQPSESKKCEGGVDLNRNWDAFWGLGNGTSSNPCHEQFQGPFPLSEPEVSGLARVVKETRGIRAHLDLHSFGQFLYRGWAYPQRSNTTKEKRVERRQFLLARAIRIAVRKAYGNDMVDVSARLATIAMTRRLNGGSSLDFFMNLGIPSITAEIGPKLSRENIATGSETPENDLLMRSREMFEGIQMVLTEADPERKVPEYSNKEMGIALP